MRYATRRFEAAPVEYDPAAWSAMPEWRARWIWLDPERFGGYERTPATAFVAPEAYRFGVGVFYTELELTALPVRAWAAVSADVFYRLTINGRRIGMGPAEIGGDYGKTDSPDWWYFDRWPLPDCWQTGRNRLVIEVVNQELSQRHYSSGHAGWIGEFHLELADGTTRTVLSGPDWLAALNPAFAAPNVYEAAANPLGDYRAADYELTGAWFPAVAVPAAPAARWHLLPAEIPPLFECVVYPARLELPFGGTAGLRRQLASLAAGAGGEAIFPVGAPVIFYAEFDTELTGYLEFEVAGRRGASVLVEYCEQPNLPHQSEVVKLQDGVTRFTSIRLNAFQSLRITVRTGDWAATACEAVVLRNLRAHFVSYPAVHRGQFVSSRPSWNALWRIAAWTTQLCRQGMHLDSPVHQEGLGCTADYMIESMLNYYVFADRWLTRQDIRRTALLLRQQNGRMFHTVFALLWIQMVMDYRLYTGDGELALEVRPEVDLVLERFAGFVGPEGLVSEACNYMFIDWVWCDAFNLHHPPAQLGMGPAGAFYFRALGNGAELAELAGDGERAALYRRRAAALQAAFRQRLWVAERGLFRDGVPFLTRVAPNDWLPADALAADTFSYHTNVLAAAFGLVPPEEGAQLLERLAAADDVTGMQPYFYYYYFEALRVTDCFDRWGTAALRRWEALIAEHPASLKECWNAGDYSHAWSSAAAVALARCVLGVVLTAPDRVTIAPHPGTLRTLSGVVPLVSGELKIVYRRRDRCYRITLPRGVTAEWKLGDRVMTLSGGTTHRISLD